MNYFELYQIPLSFQPDRALVKKRFYQLSRAYHPDFYSNAIESEKERILSLSAQVNKAYLVLQDQEALIRYILLEKGLMKEEEKYPLSSDFLMEVMDLNEQLMEADDAATKLDIKKVIQSLQNEIYEPIKAIITNYQEGITSEKELLQIKEYYYRKKYLDRILAEL